MLKCNWHWRTISEANIPQWVFSRGLVVLLERQQWLLQGLSASALELLYTQNKVQKCGVNWTCWFPYVHNMEGPSVCHIHDTGELACIKLLSLQTQTFYSSVTEAPVAARFPFGQACLLLSTAISYPLLPMGGMSKWCGGGGQRQLWQRHVYAGLSCCSSVPNGEQSMSAAQRGVHKASLCVWRERLSCPDIATGSSCAIGRLWCSHSFLPPSLTQISCLPLMGLSHLGSAVSWEPSVGLNLLSFCEYFSTSMILSILWQSTGSRSEEIPLLDLSPLSMARQIASCGTHWDPRREKIVVLTPTFPDIQRKIKKLCPQLFHFLTVEML